MVKHGCSPERVPIAACSNLWYYMIYLRYLCWLSGRFIYNKTLNKLHYATLFLPLCLKRQYSLVLLSIYYTPRLTHIYTREWCNNFIPRRPVKKKRKEEPCLQQNIFHNSWLAAGAHHRVWSPCIIDFKTHWTLNFGLIDGWIKIRFNMCFSGNDIFGVG